MIPVSAIVITRNEATNIGRCLASLESFAEIIVVDSNSADDTVKIAAAAGAQVISFTWNGEYPKKRQACLDYLELKHDWVFFVDADEVVTDDLVRELTWLFSQPDMCDGYFVKSRYVIGGKALRFGLQNNKLCLFDRRKFAFPVIDDLDLPGMGEVEGHYQPVPKDGAQVRVGQVYRAAMLHYAYENGWEERHRNYARWEFMMNIRKAWPRDPVMLRQKMKEIFRAAPCRGVAAFLHCYVLQLGFLDGAAGIKLARDRLRYYRMIGRAGSENFGT